MPTRKSVNAAKKRAKARVKKHQGQVRTATKSSAQAVRSKAPTDVTRQSASSIANWKKEIATHKELKLLQAGERAAKRKSLLSRKRSRSAAKKRK